MDKIQSVDVVDDLVTEDEAAKILHQAPRTLTVWRCDGKGPRYTKLGRRIFYRRSWLGEYIEKQTVSPTPKGGQANV